MSKPAIDLKRRVRAIPSAWTEPPCELIDGRWHSPPGTMVPREQEDGRILDYVIACPGCGQMGTGRDGMVWRVIAGKLEDVTTLSLTPSILNGCCGWHGYLTAGVVEPC